MAGLAYRPEIDGLRAIAVVAVVLYHLDPSLLPGGYVGVDVFFVVSGYLITSLLAAEWRGTGRIDLTDFYARRIRRLMPALWLVVGTVMLASVFLLGPLGEPFHLTMDSAIASLGFLANFYFLQTTVDYFGARADQMPLLHLWSLGVEEQFYLVFPLLLGWMLARGPRFTWRCLGLLAILSMLLAEHWLAVKPANAFFHMPARFWELAAGAMIALLPSVLPVRARLWPWLAAMGLVLVLGSAMLTGLIGHFPGIGALPAVVGTALVLIVVHARGELGWTARWLASGPMVTVGLWSYPLYLWHWPLLAMDRAIRLEPSTLAWRAGLCLVAVALAGLTYRFVEQPVRRRWRWPSRRILLGGIAATVGLIAVAGSLGRQDFVPEERSGLVIQTRDDRPANMNLCHFGLGSRIVSLQRETCLPDAGRPSRVAIWGDSHALAWGPFAEALADARGRSVLSITMDSCAPLLGRSQPHRNYPRHRENCEALNALAIERLTEPGAFDLVILAARWAEDVDATEEGAGLSARLDATLARLAQAVPEVIVLGPAPALAHPAPRCIAAGRLDECAVPTARFEAEVRPVREALEKGLAGHGGIRFVDPSRFLCEGDTCPVMKDGYALYWDDDHFTSTAARAFGESYLLAPSRYTLDIPPPPSGR